MELRQLKCVLAVADYGSFTDAAAALHLTQPTLSYAVAQLERELGARLFDRSARRTAITEAGEAFLGPARAAINEADRAQAAVVAIAGVVTGDLRIVCVRTAVVEASQHLAAFQRAFPGVRLVVEDPTGDHDVVRLVRAGLCEIGVLRSTVPQDLDSVPLGTQHLVVLYPSALAPKRPTVTLAGLAGTPLVVALRGTRSRTALEAMVRNAGIEPTVAAECANLEMRVELVRGGVGAMITSNSRAAMLNNEGLTVRQLQPKQPTPLTAVWQATNASPAATAFMGTLEQLRPTSPRIPLQQTSARTKRRPTPTDRATMRRG